MLAWEWSKFWSTKLEIKKTCYHCISHTVVILEYCSMYLFWSRSLKKTFCIAFERFSSASCFVCCEVICFGGFSPKISYLRTGALKNRAGNTKPIEMGHFEHPKRFFGADTAPKREIKQTHKRRYICHLKPLHPHTYNEQKVNRSILLQPLK